MTQHLRRYICDYASSFQQQTVRSTVITMVNPLQRLTTTSSTGLGTTWLYYLSPDIRKVLQHEAGLIDTTSEIEHEYYSKSNLLRLGTLIAPALDRFIWSRPDLFHHSPLNSQAWLEIGRIWQQDFQGKAKKRVSASSQVDDPVKPNKKKRRRAP